MANMTQCDESDAIADAIGNLLHLAHAIGIDPKETSAKAMRMFEEEIAIEPPGQIWPEVAEFGKKYDDQISD
jgi:hypothetical protein